MNNAKNLHDVSAVYFFILAFIYVFAALSLRNSFVVDYAALAMRVLDIPFAMVSLMYGASSLYMQINSNEEEGTNPWIMVIFAISILLFGFVVFLNFAFPSQL
ncbi:hypothetical protein JW758_00885 [Candidatus Peregrinibacteria bacterium]|nr:hypothetical protein [Candidatus Peregrinibacteria bacterium]